MPVSLANTGVTLPSVGVSLRSSVGPLPWEGESLLDVGVSLSSASMSPTSSSTAAPPPLVWQPTYHLMYAN